MRGNAEAHRVVHGDVSTSRVCSGFLDDAAVVVKDARSHNNTAAAGFWIDVDARSNGDTPARFKVDDGRVDRF